MCANASDMWQCLSMLVKSVHYNGDVCTNAVLVLLINAVINAVIELLFSAWGGKIDEW